MSAADLDTNKFSIGSNPISFTHHSYERLIKSYDKNLPKVYYTKAGFSQ